MSASTELLVLVDADNVFPGRLQPVLDLVAVQQLNHRIVAAGAASALGRLRWPAGTEQRPATGWQSADVVLASCYEPSANPLLLVTGDGDFGLLASRHPGPVLVVSGAPSSRLRAAAPILDPAVEGLLSLQQWLEAVGSSPTPPLWTPRLQLRVRTAADARRLAELFGDAGATGDATGAVTSGATGSGTSGATGGQTGSDGVRRQQDIQKRYGVSLFTVVRRDDDTVLGYAGVIPGSDAYSDDLFIESQLGSAYQEQGYAAEATNAIRGYAASVLGLRQLIVTPRTNKLDS